MKTIKICHNCGGQHLKSQVIQFGSHGECSICKESSTVICVEKITDLMVDKLCEFYEHIECANTAEDLRFLGAQTLEKILEIDTEFNEDLALIIAERLYEIDRYTCKNNPHYSISFADNHAYKRRYNRGRSYFAHWNDYCHEIKYSKRVTGALVSRILDSFLNIDEIPITTIACGTEFLRGRIALNEEARVRILENCRRELGAPHNKLANHGRMNFKGIPVFYFSFDEDSCLSELRPPVGCSVAIGKFKANRDIKVLDFTKYAEINVANNFFAPDYIDKAFKSEFIKHISKLISAPVMPGDEDMDYLPTQILVEHLANHQKLPLDGIIYASAQNGSKKNLLLFNSLADEYIKDVLKQDHSNASVEKYTLDDNDEIGICHTYANEADLSKITHNSTIEYIFGSVKIFEIENVIINYYETSCYEHNFFKDKKRKF